MKKLLTFVAVLALVLALAAPAFAQVDDSGSTGAPVPTEPTDGGQLPGGGERDDDEDEEPVVSERTDVQAEGDDTEQLADTGIDAATLATVALGLLLAGGVALVAARRAGRHG